MHQIKFLGFTDSERKSGSDFEQDLFGWNMLGCNMIKIIIAYYLKKIMKYIITFNYTTHFIYFMLYINI